MLEKPDIPEELILSHLEEEYGLDAARADFLPLGYDYHTAVYRAVTREGAAYFLKLRKGAFDEMTVAVPQFLHARGNPAVIPPLETRKRQYWGRMGAYKTILYPFIDGKNGYMVALTDRQWVDFGAALRGVHAARVPAAFRRQIQKETYSPHWREVVRAFQAQVEDTPFDDPVAARLAGFLRARRAEIGHMLERAGQLGDELRARSPEFVLCHADIHPGNLLIGADGAVYIVDWDNPILAPKERDLMFIGTGMGGDAPGGREEALFLQGYGPTQVDRKALAYYRYERILEDIAAFCEQLLSTPEGGEDREQAYRYCTGQFLPNHEVEIAYKTDRLAKRQDKNTIKSTFAKPIMGSSMSAQPTKKDVYRYFRMGLVTGLVDKQEVVAWADREILKSPIPEIEVIELSVSGKLSYSQLIHDLYDMQRESSYELPLKMIFARAGVALEADPGRAAGIGMGLRLLLAEYLLPKEARELIAGLEGELDSYRRQEIGLEELAGRLGRFLQPYREYRGLIEAEG